MRVNRRSLLPLKCGSNGLELEGAASQQAAEMQSRIQSPKVAKRPKFCFFGLAASIESSGNRSVGSNIAAAQHEGNDRCAQRT